VTSFDYDPLNRLTKLTDALAGITQYAYNGVDQLVLVTDPKGLIANSAACRSNIPADAGPRFRLMSGH
jgi:YD repeat-containing protein